MLFSSWVKWVCTLGEILMLLEMFIVNFLGIIELISHYIPVLREHVTKVHESQKEGKRIQAHYLSKDSQNEFIHISADKVRRCILEERDNAKYFSIMVDTTPNVSHIE